MRLSRRVLAGIPAIFFCCILAATAGDTKKHPPAHPLDLNTATAEQLEQLPAVGPTTAKSIIQFREKSGPFRRVEDLLAIRGITKQRLTKIRPYVTVASTALESKKQPH
ncbi:MAG: ComEA family DNA-binding protein [Candidatus Acidiferrales bacterium]